MELAELLLEAKEERYQGFDYEYDDFCQVQPSLTVLLDEIEPYLPNPEQTHYNNALHVSEGLTLNSYTAASPSASTCSEESSDSTTICSKSVTAVAKRRNKRAKGKLWEFLKDILNSEKTNPSIIKWEDEKNGIFRIVKSENVAKLWGLRKDNPSMTYEKMSRALRYYYQQDILGKRERKRLVFHFGNTS